MEQKRQTARQLAEEFLKKNKPLNWFEKLYELAEGDETLIPWADMTVNPNLASWLKKENISGNNSNALVIGCGLGDDAEAVANLGFKTIAFDISTTAISWCKERFLDSSVNYSVVDLFASPVSWQGKFDFVLESYTLQVLPPELRRNAIAQMVSYLAPGGRLLVICRGRDRKDSEGEMPWPLTREELGKFEELGLKKLSFEDYLEAEMPPVRRFRAFYANIN